jgi:acyl-CoA dehydrogenase
MTSSNTPLPSLTYLRPEVVQLKVRLDDFIENHVLPAEEEYNEHMATRAGEDRWSMEALPPSLSELQREAQKLGLWNLFLPPRLIPHLPASAKSLAPSTPLTYREYGILAESMGRSELGAMACNCSAPDTGNMEVLLEFGTPQQKEMYLIPLLQGRIRSTFLMTEPQVASSDPTNLETKLLKKSNNEYILSGRKWWSTGAMDPRCRMALVVAKIEDTTSTSDTNKHNQHTIVLVPLPHPKVRAVRPLTVFGYDDAPFGHADVVLDNVPLTREQLVGGEGSGFKVSQARLGPGRIHHCMRAIGMSKSTVALICIFRKQKSLLILCSAVVILALYSSAQRCYELMLQRSVERKTFGKYLWQHGSVQSDIADSFGELQAARLLTLHCAHEMDQHGPRKSRQYISSIKVQVPQLCSAVIDRALQVFGGAGVSEDFVIAKALANVRTLRIADGPDQVHRRSVALLEMKNLYRKTFGTDPPRSRL